MEVLDTVGAVIPIYWEIIHISSLSMGIMYITWFDLASFQSPASV